MLWSPPTVAIPMTMVQNTTGTIVFLTILMKASPIGLNSTANSGAKCPRVTPRMTPNKTWKYNCM